MHTSKKRLLADASLLGVAISWGYTFILAKDLLEEMTPLFFTGSRFLLAGLILAIWQWKRIKELTWFYWKAGIVSGLLLCMAFTAQIFGIELTTPGKAGMITGTSVVMVPFFYFLWSRTPIQKGPILGSICAFIGLALFSWDGSLQGMNTGDLLVLSCALCFAIHTVYVDRTYEKEEPVNVVLFSMVQLTVVGLIDLVLAAFLEPAPTQLSPYGWYAYLFELLIGTLLAYVIQLRAQYVTQPIRVSMILSLESVFAFLFSWLLWGETITYSVLIGAVLVLAGIYITELFNKAEPHRLDDPRGDGVKTA
ncbi:MAG: DMT family transporter [Clostridia bacterium]